MNPESPANRREELEARLTALLLGELPPVEAAALRVILAEDAQLAALHERLKQAIDLVRQASATPAEAPDAQAPPRKLSDARRQRLLAHFKTVRPKEFARPPRRGRLRLFDLAAVAAAAALLLLVPIVIPNFIKARNSSASNSIINNLRQIDGAKLQWALENGKSDNDTPTLSDIAPYLGRGSRGVPPSSAMGERYVIGKVGESPVAELNPAKARQLFGDRAEAQLPGGARGGRISLDDAADFAEAGRQAGPPAGRSSSSHAAGSVQAETPESTTVTLSPAPPTSARSVVTAGGVDYAESGVATPTPQPAPVRRLEGGEFAGAAPQTAIGQAVRREAFKGGGEPARAGPPPAKPAAPNIVLPAVADVENSASIDATKGIPPQAGYQLGFGASGGGGGFGGGVGGVAPQPTGGEAAGTGRFVGNPEWIGLLEKQGSLTYTTNPFIARYAFNAPVPPPASAATERIPEEASINKQAIAATDATTGLPIAPTEQAEENAASAVPTPAAAAAPPPVELKGKLAEVGQSAPAGPGTAGVTSATYYSGGAYGGYVAPKAETEAAKESAAAVQVPILGDKPEVGRSLQVLRAHRATLGATVTNAWDRAKIELPDTSVGAEDQFRTRSLAQAAEAATAGTPPEAKDQIAGFGGGALTSNGKFIPAAQSVSGGRTLPSRTLRLPGVEAEGEATNALGLVQAGDLAGEGQIKLQIRDGTAPSATPQVQNPEESKAYVEAKRNLEELVRLRTVLDRKIASEGADVGLPKTTMVEIVDKAVPQPAQSQSLYERIRANVAGGYESTARVKVERDQSDISGLQNRQLAQGYDPYFVQSETEVIQSDAVLGKVVKDLNLDDAWADKNGRGGKLSTQETVELLKKKLDLRPAKGTNLLDIGVKSDKPEEAARIANAVADAYKAHRLEQRRQTTMSGIEALQGGSAELDQKIRKAQEEVDRLREGLNKQNIPDATATAIAKNEPDVVRKVQPATPPPIPQPEVQTRDNAWSTFSLNVSDVSFKLAAASLEKGVLPEPAGVRSEEFINAFDYRDPEPPPGVPIAFAWERAQYPFAQNRDLLRFSIKTAALGRQAGRPLNLVLLLDTSGSMERADRVRIIHEALRVLAGQLQPQDKLSVVTFARTARLWVDGVAGTEAAGVAEAVSGITPQGGTNLEDAMNLAYQTALRHYLAEGINRVVLLTDGAANLGNVEPEALKQKVEAHRKQGIALDCFGIGWEGYNDDLLEVLSRNGDGRYGFVNTPEEAATEFAGQLAGALHVAASDVKVQVEFNPNRVTVYRQIGYAKHQLTKEQFRDNTVNAAQIGAAESGNALYVIEVNPRGGGPLGTVRVRYRVPGTAEYHEHEWAVPYTGNAVPLEGASPAMRLAATASAFSEWLASSPYATEVTTDRLLGYLRGVPEVCGADARPKKLEWMIRQAKSLTGK